MIYIAIGQLAGTALQKVASPVLVANDNLLVGPSCSDSTRHHTARKRYWGSAPSRSFDEHLRGRRKLALCVFFPPTCNGLLSLCRISQSALETDSELHVIEFGAEGTPAVSQEVDLPREVCIDYRALQSLPPAIRWSRLQTALAASLWRLWCWRSPAPFSRFCGSSAALHPQLANLGRYHAGLFPRITQRGILLSRLDELILRQLTHEWTTPARLYASAVRTSPQLSAWLTYTGDLYLANRLLAWATHTRGRLVEKQEQARAQKSEMMSWSFRWCPGAETILDHLPELDGAPQLLIGGAVAYDSKHPWCSRSDPKANMYVVRPRTPGGS